MAGRIAPDLMKVFAESKKSRNFCDSKSGLQGKTGKLVEARKATTFPFQNLGFLIHL
jgi:hypothetical protein